MLVKIYFSLGQMQRDQVQDFFFELLLNFN